MPPKCDLLTKDMEFSLAHEVELRPILWDTSLELYRRTDLKVEAWNEVAAHVGLPGQGDKVAKTFKNMGDTFRNNYTKVKESRNKCSGSGANDIFKPSWYHYESLKYLEKTCVQGGSVSNIPENTQIQSCEPKLYYDETLERLMMLPPDNDWSSTDTVMDEASSNTAVAAAPSAFLPSSSSSSQSSLSPSPAITMSVPSPQFVLSPSPSPSSSLSSSPKPVTQLSIRPQSPSPCMPLSTVSSLSVPVRPSTPSPAPRALSPSSASSYLPSTTAPASRNKRPNEEQFFSKRGPRKNSHGSILMDVALSAINNLASQPINLPPPPSFPAEPPAPKDVAETFGNFVASRLSELEPDERKKCVNELMQVLLKY